MNTTAKILDSENSQILEIGGASAWGDISGVIENQIDLWNYLSGSVAHQADTDNPHITTLDQVYNWPTDGLNYVVKDGLPTALPEPTPDIQVKGSVNYIFDSISSAPAPTAAMVNELCLTAEAGSSTGTVKQYEVVNNSGTYSWQDESDVTVEINDGYNCTSDGFTWFWTGSSWAIYNTLTQHEGNFNNPHRVTASQISAAPISHMTDYSNPHQVTATQVDAYDKSEVDGFISDIKNNANLSGSYWWGKTQAATIVPVATNVTENYFDFTTNNIYRARAYYPGGTYDEIAATESALPTSGLTSGATGVTSEDGTVPNSVKTYQFDGTAWQSATDLPVQIGLVLTITTGPIKARWDGSGSWDTTYVAGTNTSPLEWYFDKTVTPTVGMMIGITSAFLDLAVDSGLPGRAEYNESNLWDYFPQMVGVGSVDSVTPDSTKNIELTRIITQTQRDAMISDPTQAIPGVRYLMYEDGPPIYVNPLLTMGPPDINNRESINRISTNGGSWTVDRDGYIQWAMRCHSTGTATKMIATLRVAGLLAQYTSNIAPVGSAAIWETSLIYPVVKGQVIKLQCGTDYDGTMTGMAFDSASCQYVPPVINPPAVLEKPLLNYSTVEQDTGQLWIDGKKVYQKTFLFNFPTTSTGGTYVVNATEEIRPAAVVEAYGRLYNMPGVSYDFAIPCTSITQFAILVQGAGNTNIRLVVSDLTSGGDTRLKGCNAQVTVKYTKV